ncbi:hypothetical protein GCM10009783_02450 [Glycomyces lechevalierae]
MPFGGQDLGEAQRDLSVPSGDDDMHTAHHNPARGGACRSAPHRSRPHEHGAPALPTEANAATGNGQARATHR